MPKLAKTFEKYYYEIFPVNFVNLPIEKQEFVIESFKNFLNSLEKSVKIIVCRDEKSVRVGGQEMLFDFYRFFVEAQEPLDVKLKAMNMTFQSIPSVPEFKFVREGGAHLYLEGGALARVFTVYKMPPSIVEGFLTETYGVVERVVISINPLDQERAVGKLGRLKTTLEGLRLAEIERRRTPKADLEMKISYVTELLNRIAGGGERIFDIRIILCVAGKNLQELREKAAALKSILGGRLVRIDSPKFVQSLLLEGKVGRTLTVNSETAGTLFPFSSADIIESDGIFLGVNSDTGSPIIFDPTLRPNLNTSIIGVTGSGKSFTTKVIVNRLIEKNPDIAVFIIDPENEYVRLGERWGCSVHALSEGENLGLDPFNIFSKTDTADALADISRMPSQYVSRFRTLVKESDSIVDLYNRASSEIRDYLSSLVEGPESYIFSGEGIEFSSKMIFGLKNIGSETAKYIVSLLIFGKIWNTINSMPPYVLKILLIDEAWLFFSLPSSAKFIETVARLGRKRNVLFYINTQRPADILGESGISSSGRTVIENSATKLILRQDPISSDIVAKVFNLSDFEKEYVISCNPGEGILIIKDVHVPARIIPSEEEYRMFSTKPTE
ncbi:MAG: ATP-binding protein, partial [Candidatus Bathyarchaeia archaeon]